MHERPRRPVGAQGRRRGPLVGILAVLLLIGVWIAGEIRSPGRELTDASGGSNAAVRPTDAPRQPPVVASPQTSPSREVELFAQNLRLTIPGGKYSDSRNQATIVGPPLRIEIERWAAGSLHTISRGISGSVSGSELDEVADAVEQLLAADGATYIRRTRTLDHHDAVEWVAASPIPTDGRPFVVTVVIDNSTVYLVGAFVTEPVSDGLALARFVSLQTSIDFLTPSDVIALGGRVSVRVPGTMYVGTSTSRVLGIVADGGAFGLGRPVSIQRLRLGTRTTVSLPGKEVRQAVVDGRTLGDIAASLQRTSDGRLRRGVRDEVSIDGYAAYRWTYVVDSPFTPLFGTQHASVGVVIVGRDAYVIIGDDDDIIGSIRFLH